MFLGARDQAILKVPTARPALQLTVKCAVPAPVVAPMVHVQVALPPALALVAPRPVSVLCRPLGSITTSVQESRGVLECTVSDSRAPGRTDPISEVTRTLPPGVVGAGAAVVVVVGAGASGQTPRN